MVYQKSTFITLQGKTDLHLYFFSRRKVWNWLEMNIFEFKWGKNRRTDASQKIAVVWEILI